MFGCDRNIKEKTRGILEGEFVYVLKDEEILATFLGIF
jgi:hypothetical protein